MNKVTDDNPEQIVDIPNDEGMKAKGDEGAEAKDVEKTKAKDEKHKEWMSLKRFVSKVVCSEEFLLLLGLTAIALDPLFFYVPMMKNNSTCLGLDKKLIIVVVILRTFVDILHDWSWWSKSRRLKSRYSRRKDVNEKPLTCMGRFGNFLKWLKNCKISSPNRSSWWSKLRPRKSHYTRNKQANKNRLTYVDRFLNLLKGFKSCKISSPDGRSSVPARVIAILAFLPLPQVVLLAVDMQSHLKTWLKFAVLCQFVPRIFRTYPTYVAVTSSSDIYALIGAAFNLLLFVLASHALGGFWYLRAVERKLDCMEEACQGCIKSSFHCGSGNYINNRFINDACSVQPTSNATTPFDYGMYNDAIKSNLVGSMNFISKLSGGFWWGIRNLSSTAQNLDFNDHIWDTCFQILICILGLVLFALLIGNLQTYMQSKLPSTLAKLKERREELQSWPLLSSVPDDLKKELSMCRTRKWQDVGEINLESLLNNIPLDLKTKIKPYFCEKLFHKVEKFEELDWEIKNDLRKLAKPMVFQARTNIYQEGYPIYEMIHIVHGSVLAHSNKDVKEGLPAIELKKNDSFGEELLARALESPEPKLPLATQTIRSVTKVEAFVLSFGDFSTIFTKHGRKFFVFAYRKEWAAHKITGAIRKKAATEKWKKSSQEGNEQLLNGRKILQSIHVAPEPSSPGF